MCLTALPLKKSSQAKKKSRIVDSLTTFLLLIHILPGKLDPEALYKFWIFLFFKFIFPFITLPFRGVRVATRTESYLQPQRGDEGSFRDRVNCVALSVCRC